MKNVIRTAALAGASLVLGLSAQASQVNPGSLLVFPSFDNTRGDYTLLTVTNMNDDQTNGTVKVEFVYINHDNCQEFNRTRTLTPDDTITVVTKVDNPNQVFGYCYVFAKHKTTGAAIKFDYLIGTERVLSCNDGDYEVQPFVFQAGAGLADGANTDANGNGLRDLNGTEYSKAPDTLYIPRFLGQCDAVQSKLALIALTGGAQFDTLVNFLIYNDNEEVFSAQRSFNCYEQCDLLHISGVFGNDFLLSTNHNQNEIQWPNNPLVDNVNPPEAGWFSLKGAIANSSAASFSNPSILAALIERTPDGSGTVLPFVTGERANGSLLSQSIFGN